MSLFDTPFVPRARALVTGAGRASAAPRQAWSARACARYSPTCTRKGCWPQSRPRRVPTWPGLVGDLARREACDALLAHAQSTLGRVTHFVHSASPPCREADHVMAVDGGDLAAAACGQSGCRLSSVA